MDKYDNGVEKLGNLIPNINNKFKKIIHYKYIKSKIEINLNIIRCILLLLTFIIISYDNKFSLSNQLNKIGKEKVIAVDFAGRKKYLEILNKYLFELLNNNKLSEIHYWLFTNDKNNIQYILNISNYHYTSKKHQDYIEIFPLVINNSFELNIKGKGDKHILINDNIEILTNENKIILKDITKCNKDINITDPFIKLKNDENLSIIIKIKMNYLEVKTEKLSQKVNIKENKINSIKIKGNEKFYIYWNYKESINKRIKSFDTDNSDGWYQCYKFYLTYDFDVFFKIDDDVLFIDLNRYDEFIEYIIKNKSKTSVIPNLINHSVSVFYNNKYNLIPNSILNKEYKHKSNANDIHDYFKDGEQANKIHEYFLNNYNKFLNNNITTISLDEHKPSICVMGINKIIYNKIFSLENNTKLKSIVNKNFYDEGYIYRLKNNVFYPRFVTSHLQFKPQLNKLKIENLLIKYKNLSNKYLNDYKTLKNIIR